MLDIKFIRENPEKVKKGAKDKGITIDVDEIIQLDKEASVLNVAKQKLQEERNSAAKDKNIEKGREIKQKLDDVDAELEPLEKALKTKLLEIPNLPKEDVPSEDEEVKKEGKPTKFEFVPKDHLEIGEMLDIIDVQRAAKISGTRFGYLKNAGALLEFALVQFAFETLIKEGFKHIVPPVLIKKEITEKLGYWNGGGNEDYYLVTDPEENAQFYLVGTAEHAIVPMHSDEVLNKKDLPLRYVGFSTAFRREAGTYGKDTRGILRVHQFDKVEMVSFVENGKEDEEHEFLLSQEEKLFKSLEIPYRVVRIKATDLGFPISSKFDIEAWLPGQDMYREMTSVSTTGDFQARRLNIRYQDAADKKFVNILNGTGFAIGRTIIAILENHQEKDGSVRVPEILQKYMGGLKKIIAK